MRMYLNAKSKLGISYTPDWIRFNYNEGDKYHTMCFDIQGSISYKEKDLNCLCKAELIPFVYYDEDAKEYDLTIEENDPLFDKFSQLKEISKIIEKSFLVEVGVCPVTTGKNDDIWNIVEDDSFEKCNGWIELISKENEINLEKEFEFDVEINV